MKGLLVLLVFAAAGLAGVLYFRRSLHAPAAPVVASSDKPAREAKERRVRRRRGARRLPYRVGAAATGPSEAPQGEAPAREGASAPPSEAPAPIPGGASISEAPPEDVFGPAGPSPSPAGSGAGPRPSDEPAPIKLRPADLKMVWQGEDLSRAETMRLDFSNDSNGHDLTDAEIDARFRTKEDAVLGCIARSRPSEDADVPGHVTVRFRIQRSGAVKGVQVEAPVILHKGGLTGCLKNVVGGLRFPASNTGQVISFPFSLM